MKRILLLSVAITLAPHPTSAQWTQRKHDVIIKGAFSTSILDYVNPLVGTQKMGHTFPGACVPFGSVQLSPDTEMVPHNINGVYQPEAYEYCAGYQYDDTTILGFSHTHFSGTGHSDLGDILIMPATGPLLLDRGTSQNPETGYRSRFSHERETASPGYYSVMLDDYGIKAELTATPRTGIHRYTFPQGTGRIVIDLTHGIYNYDGKVLWANLRVENDTTLTGYRITRGWARTNYTHFAIRLSKPIQNYGHRNNEQVAYNGFWRRFNVSENFPEMGGTQITAFFEFDFAEGETLELKVALSAVDALGALKNLEAETAGKSFDQLLNETQSAWEKELSIFNIQGPRDQKCVFYTALYHAMIHPSLYMDVDGRYRGIDHNIHQAEGFTNYTIFSLWDTFRASHPLMNLIRPDLSRNLVASMLAHYQQSVHKALPVWSHKGNENWCMIGYHGVSVLADAWVKGILSPDDFPPEQLLEAMIQSANIPYYDGSAEYAQLGYVPLEVTGNAASVTLENAYEDWCIYQFAQSNGYNEVAETYQKRARSYQNIFDPTLGFARPRYRDGRWKDDFDLLDTHGQGFIEGNSWNYSFFIPHDVPGLIQQMGGKAVFERRLDSLFTMHLPDRYFENTEDITREGLMGNYVHGNEPSHHVPYLYACTNHPSKGQSRIRTIMNQMYQNKIDGLCGNDDCGQMSAWYIFSAMGFYPVCPGSDQYVIGVPYFPKMVVRLENGKELTILANQINDQNIYIQSIKLNGKALHEYILSHTDIAGGGVLEFEMGPEPYNIRPAIIPEPATLTPQQGLFLLNSDVELVALSTDEQQSARYLAQYLKKQYGVHVSTVAKPGAGPAIVFTIENDKNHPITGEYHLMVAPDQITLTGYNAPGLFYAVQSLIQLIPAKESATLEIPAVDIYDFPAFAYRGMHFDVVRHIFPVDYIKKYIDYLALHKMNYFHWHLTDDQGWRIESAKYPLLNTVGAWRDGTIIGMFPGTGIDTTRHGGYYTVAELREVVDYAKERYITVIPEVDIPAHCMAAISAYPELSTTPDSLKKPAITWGIFNRQNNVLAPNPYTFTFIKEIFNELIDIFHDSPYIHFGADEASHIWWNQSAQAQEFMKQNNMKDEGEIQDYLVRIAIETIQARGKTAIGWDEIMTDPQLDSAVVVMNWRGQRGGGVEAANRGHKVIMTPSRFSYLNTMQRPDETQTAHRNLVTLDAVYLFNPIPDSLSVDAVKNIIGGQGCMWTEYYPTPDKVEYGLFPRMSAIAETYWSGQERKDLDKFKQKLSKQFDLYDLWGARYSTYVIDIGDVKRP